MRYITAFLGSGKNSKIQTRVRCHEHGIMSQSLVADKTYQGVVSATVNVLCELALRNPMDYLPLAPQLFHILTTSANNWMLIKIVKLVCELVHLLLEALTLS